MRLFVFCFSFVIIFVTVRATMFLADYKNSAPLPEIEGTPVFYPEPEPSSEPDFFQQGEDKDTQSEPTQPTESNPDFSVIRGGTWNFDYNEVKLTNPALWNIAVTNTPVKSNFSVTFSGEQAFVVLGYIDYNNYYYVALNKYDISLAGIYKVQNGYVYLLTTISPPHFGNNTLEVEQKPGKISIRLDRVLVGSYKDSKFLPGIIGFGSAGTDAMFAELELL